MKDEWGRTRISTCSKRHLPFCKFFCSVVFLNRAMVFPCSFQGIPELNLQNQRMRVYTEGISHVFIIRLMYSDRECKVLIHSEGSLRDWKLISSLPSRTGAYFLSLCPIRALQRRETGQMMVGPSAGCRWIRGARKDLSSAFTCI